MKLLQVFQASYACLLCLLHLQVAMVVSESEVISPPIVAQSTLVRHDKKVPSSSLLGPDQLRDLQAVATTWVQVGNDIDGEGEYDWSGSSVAVSEDGSRVAIGAWLNDNDNGIDSGHVRVYDYTKSSSDSWVQVGNDIDGEGENDQSGYSGLAMSDDGSRVAIGATGNDNGNGGSSGHVRVYDYESSSDSWVQVGNDIDGEGETDYSGISVAMSDDGSRVAIGAYLNDNDNGSNSGHVRVYDYESSSDSWVQVGNDIDGEGDYNRSGESLAMSDDGSRVAIGASFNDNDNGYNSGHVRVYDYDSSSDSWVQVGNDIDGEASCDLSGESVAMSDDGSRVAIGAKWNDDNGIDSGHVRVYDYDSSSDSWVQVGNDIEGEAESDYSGGSVAMSGNGTRVAIGATGGNGSNSGHVRVYDYESSSESWVQVGNDVDGESGGDYSGSSVAMSDDGSKVAIGAWLNDNENGLNSGHVRVYTATPSPASCSTYGSESECANVSGSNNCFWFDRLGRCKDCSVLPREFLCVRKGCTWNVDSCE